MRSFYLLAGFAALIAVPDRPALAVPLSPSVARDVQCFLLYAAAAGSATDDKAVQAASVGTMYFVGRIDVGAPGLDLVAALRQEADALEGNPKAKDIGESCDSQLAKRGTELIDVGEQLKKTTP